MKTLTIALTLLFSSLAHASVTDDAKHLHALTVEAGDAGHVCVMLIDLKQPAALYCDKFRELTYRINAMGVKYDTQEKHDQLIEALKNEADHTFKDTVNKINKAADRLGVKL